MYIYGQVGRGKSMLMDLFFDSINIKEKRRVHFNEFMNEVHEEIFKWREKNKLQPSKEEDKDPILMVAKLVKKQCKLLCFDEFQVEDIADAMILGRLFKILFDMKKDLNEVKKVISKIQNDDPNYKISDLNDISEKLNDNFDKQALVTINDKSEYQTQNDNFEYAEEIFEEETLSIQDKELELIIKSLERNNGKRKAAAKELGISERTLYRKIKQYDIKL